MSLRVREHDLHVLGMRTRMPFRYGIACLTAAPLLFARLAVEVDGRFQAGLACDILAPKWFTKNPATTLREDMEEMLEVIRTACRLACEAAAAPTTFDLWQEVDARQQEAALERGWPPLLASFGVSLVERAVIDALCRSRALTFAEAVRRNALGIRLGEIHEELGGLQPAHLLPGRPLHSLRVRHTVGLADPLEDADIPAGERLRDGLPQSLAACCEAYGLTRFKIKLSGDVERDLDRLRRVGRLLDTRSADFALTLDGNEQYRRVAALRRLWERLRREPGLALLLDRMLFLEQPLHRDVALSPGTARELLTWEDRPPLIIDESDGSLDSARQALECGYAGTSHKNCKGVIKGLANACLLAWHRRRDPARRYIMSAEDLTTVGPVALLQDLAVVATLGIDHAERNGHHYVRGLSMYPEDIQAAVLAHHADLYCRRGGDLVTLDIRAGRICLGSVVGAPFGTSLELDPHRFTPEAAWSWDSLT